MNDKLLLVALLHFRAMWKYRWRGLYTAFGVALLGAVIVMAIPKRYEASARIYANTDSILKPLLEGLTVQPDINQRVVMLSRVVISRPNVERLIDATGLDEKVKTPEGREKLVDEVMKLLELQRSPERGANNVYIVRFKDTKPERAKHVVELLVSMFIDTSKGGGESDTQAAKTFLDEQAALYEGKLREAENRLKDFRLRNMGGMTAADGRDFLTQMAAVGDQMSQAQLMLREAENSRDAFRRGLASEDMASAPSTGGGLGADNVLDIDARIDAQKRSLDGLLQRYTEGHPDVVGARRVIRELEEQRQQLVAQYRKAGVPLIQTVPSGPRASEQIKVSLAQAEANVASLRARVAEYSTRYRQLREMARRMPEYEAELAQLNRDYEVHKRNYESLITRRESANISGEMQTVSGVADFRLVDPPRVAPGAVSPNRPLLLVVTILMGLAAGVGVMFASKEIRPCIFDRQQLRVVTGLPVLGVISLVESEQHRDNRRQDARRLIRVAIGMLSAYAAILIAMFMVTRVA
jgi:polysaccharide chain length determinant protein (PEP-CTERM system associated)